VALSSIQVAAGSGLVSLLFMGAAWGRPEAHRPWAQTLVGEPYRHQVLEVKAPVPLSVRLAVPLAWAVVGVCALGALVLSLRILLSEVHKDAGSVLCATYPCERPTAPPPGPSFDARSGELLGVYLIVTGAALGAFARWARDAARDMNQARRSAPLVAGGVLVVVALGLHPLLQLAEREFIHGVRVGRPDVGWLMTLVHVGVVLLGTVAIAVARRSAPAH